MRSLLRDILLSYFPVEIRRIYPPDSTARLVYLATVTGLVQMLVFALLLLLRYYSFLVMRARQLPQLAFMGEKAQAGTMVLSSFEFFLYPVTLVLLYFILEGAVRFAGGLCFSEVVPTFPAFAGCKIFALRQGRHAKEQERNAPPDLVEWLEDERIRIARPLPKSEWNSSITIGIGGKWYEVEKEQRDVPPYSYIYVLRPAPAGKILRGYEEYHPAAPAANLSPGK